MLLSLVLLLILVSALFTGYRRGLVQEVIYSVGYLLLFILAKIFTAPFAEILNQHFNDWTNNPLTNLTAMNSIAFIILMAIGGMILHFIGRVAKFLTKLPVIHQFNDLGGAILHLAVTYLITFIILSISQFVPSDFYQEQLSQSIVAQHILSDTPAISSKIINNYIIDTPQTADVIN